MTLPGRTYRLEGIAGRWELRLGHTGGDAQGASPQAAVRSERWARDLARALQSPVERRRWSRIAHEVLGLSAPAFDAPDEGSRRRAVETLANRLAELAESGRIYVEWQPRVPPARRELALQELPSGPRAPADKASWISLRVVDQDDKPVPRRAFRIKDSGGELHEGFLAGESTRVELLSSGPVAVTLPDIDPRETQKAPMSVGRRKEDAGPVESAGGDGTVHIVEEGESLLSIADRYQWLHWIPVWNDAGNAALRQARDNPHCLLPGDQVHIPLRKAHTLRAVAEQQVTVRVFVSKPALRLRVVGGDGAHVSLAAEGLQGGGLHGARVEGELLVAGCSPSTRQIVLQLPGDASSAPAAGPDEGAAPVEGAAAAAPPPTLDVAVGSLPPLAERAGVIARLRNLGFDAGDLDAPSDEALSLAIEEFQREHGKTVTGKRDGAFLADLFTEHGQ